MPFGDWKYRIDISDILLRSSELEASDVIPEDIRLDIIKELKKLPARFHRNNNVLTDLVELLQYEYTTVDEFNFVFNEFYDFADNNKIWVNAFN